MGLHLLERLKCQFTDSTLGIFSIIGGFLVQLTLGGVYTYGNMAPYILNYMRNHTSPFDQITVGNCVWIFGLSVFGLGAIMSFGEFIETKIGTVSTILLGSWTMSFGVLVTYWTINVHFVLVAISYGLVVGLGVGIAYGLILSIPSEWFPDRKGFVTGIVVAGFGFGPITFDFLQSYYINPKITTADLDQLSNVPFSFILMGLVYASIQLIGSIMIRRPSSSICRSKSLDEPENTLCNIIMDTDLKPNMEYSSSLSNRINLKPHQLLLERDFWILWITYALNSVVAVMILSLHKIFGTKLNIDDQYLTIFSAGGALCSGIGRILWGYFNDRIPYKVLMSILSLCMSLMLGTFYLTAMVGDKKQFNDPNRLIMYCIWVLFLHFLLSGNFTLFPTICSKTFGSEHFTGNYGLLFTGYSFAGIVTSAVTTKLLETGNEPWPYLAPFMVGSGLSLIASGITLFYRGKSLMHVRAGL